MTAGGDAGVFAVAVLLDLALGEVPSRLHPVVWMGRVIRGLETRMPRSGSRALWAGGLLVALTTGVFAGGSYLILAAASQSPWAYGLVSAMMLTTTFSVRLLLREVGGLGELLAAGRVDEARVYLPRLCSRDAAELTVGELGAAAISSGAENTVDSIVAPWLWWLALGVPGAVFYRAVNTLDAVVGYRGEYERLGKAAARLDDLANWVPARLTAGLMCLVGAPLSPRGEAIRRSALAVTLRDARLTPSPNGGWPMAMTAGLLGFRLAKPGAYALNSSGAEASASDFPRALGLIRKTALLAALLIVVSHLLAH